MLLGKASFQGQKHYDFPTTLFTKVNLQFCLKKYHEYEQFNTHLIEEPGRLLKVHGVKTSRTLLSYCQSLTQGSELKED